ncbi:MAG: hypothetical protein A3I78_00900, partial [Gammaproteobacteria bacterium RIFCSPLOWO2_02_FULL_56_15]
MLRRLFLKSHQYVSLDHPDTRLQAIEDPELFLQNHPPPLIIDEIQYAPDIFSWLKIHIDAHRNRAGQFLLTGSQSFPLMAGVTESLAGRISIFTLLSFSIREQMANKKLTLNTLKAMILRGGYPELAVNRKSDARLWFNNYVQTYLERDLRQLVNISNLTDFQRFLELLAALNGQVLNLSTMSRDLGIAVNTVKNWISILEASHQVILIKPYYRNKGKRIVKSPKVYFLDTGLLCFLNGIYYHEQIFKGPSSGQLFEASVLGELIRKFHMEGEIPKIYWWRTNTGEEIDFILERGQKIFPLEIKLTTRSHQGLIKNMASFCKLF